MTILVKNNNLGGGKIMSQVLNLYVKGIQNGEDEEFCCNVEISDELTKDEYQKLRLILTDGFDEIAISTLSLLDITEVKGVEIGPLMNFSTSFSSKLVAFCHDSGLDKITRVERSIRYLTDDVDATVIANCDRTRQGVYKEPLVSFDTDVEVKPTKIIPLIEKGIEAFDSLEGLSFTQQDKEIYYNYFVKEEGRNPTEVELFDLLNSNCEHSRHGWFNAKIIIDGVEEEFSAFDLVKSTLKANPNRSVIGFHDNASSIRGYVANALMPINPGKTTEFDFKEIDYDITLTVETHNFPTGISPFPGAATGTGGRIRDGLATGRGSEIISGTIGYCVSTLHIPGYPMPGEDLDLYNPANMATGLQVLIEGSNGASNYGNEIGEPLTQGFCYNFDIRLPNGQRWGYPKPILLAGGLGQMQHKHSKKGHAEKDYLIVQIGGPAYRVGFGGGAASSLHQGENDSELDFNAVQRDDAEMENKVWRVVRACNAMGQNTPIVSIHDQGAGGPGNVLKELVEEAGGRVDLAKINSGDPTLSQVETWVCEYQERIGVLIPLDRIDEFKSICEREKCPCEVLGEVTGDGRFVVVDSRDESTPVDFNLKSILADFPQAIYEDYSTHLGIRPVTIPSDLTIVDALKDVFKLLSVGSKEYLVHKVDRHVGGLIAQQQCVGPLQIPLSNVAVSALSHFDTKGAVTSQGVNPICMIANPEAGIRLSVAEMLLNMMCTKITDIKDIKASVNWMWAPKKPGEGAALYEAVNAMADFMPKLGLAVDGGKDSLSMATDVDGELVKSPRTAVVSGYATVPDVTKIITPDIKKPGESELIFVDLSGGKARLGGSAFAQTLGQIGKECPDVDNPEKLQSLFCLIQELIESDNILAYHDVSDGGLITTLCEMAISGNCGIDSKWNTLNYESNPIEKLFAEECGIILEIESEFKSGCMRVFPATIIRSQIQDLGISCNYIAKTTKEKKIRLSVNNKYVFNEKTDDLYSWWSETSFQLEKQQKNMCAEEERKNTVGRSNPEYRLTFEPEPTPKEVMESDDKFKVAVLREEGSNGDQEMISVLKMAGFEPQDVNMVDLLKGDAFLDDFTGLVPVGGFSYADCPESAKGWAMTIMNHPELASQFERFKHQSDTWSFAPCNGCQLGALLGMTVSSDIPLAERPRFIKNKSGKFESRYTTLQIPQSKSIMFKDMHGSILPIWSAHGEGQFSADEIMMKQLMFDGNVPVFYADANGNPTEDYPFNPNGSPYGIAGLCSADGRHTIMMPHPERLFQLWQFPWLPEEMQNLVTSFWLKIFQNAREWCEVNRMIENQNKNK